MKIFWYLPLTVLPFIVFNAVQFLSGTTGSVDPFSIDIFELSLISSAKWAITGSDILISGALLCLFFEILKATNTSNVTIIDHMLSTLVLIAYLLEFIMFEIAASSLFFIMLLIALIDVLAGFSVSISNARRDVTFTHGG